MSSNQFREHRKEIDCDYPQSDGKKEVNWTLVYLAAETLCYTHTQSSLCCPSPAAVAAQKHNSTYSTVLFPVFSSVC